MPTRCRPPHSRTLCPVTATAVSPHFAHLATIITAVTPVFARDTAHIGAAGRSQEHHKVGLDY